MRLLMIVALSEVQRDYPPDKSALISGMSSPPPSPLELTSGIAFTFFDSF